VGVAIADDSSLDLDTLLKQADKRLAAPRALAAIVSNNLRPKQTQTVAQHDWPARILCNAASVDRPGHGEIVMPVDDFLLPGPFAALFK
jgi:hypothetical protein